MTTETDMRVKISAQDNASPVIKGLISDLNRLKSLVSQIRADFTPKGLDKLQSDITKDGSNAMGDLRKRFTFESRMNRQRAAEDRAQERQRRAFEVAAVRDLKARTRAIADAARVELAAVRQVDRERRRAEAEQDRATRRQEAAHRRMAADRDRGDRDTIRHARGAWGRGRSAYDDLVRPPAVAAVAGIAASASLGRRALGAETAIDAAEINTRAFGGLTKAGAQELRDRWASPLAEALGLETAKLLTSWTDAVKLGIPNEGARAFSELATKTSEAWAVPFEAVTDILGTVNTILTSKGEAFDIAKIRSVANTVQHLAARQSTTPERMMSFLQRGAGAAQVLGMSQEAGLAFGSASTSLGNQAGASGRLFDYTASRIIELPRLTKQRGEEGRQANQLLRSLGYGSAESMDRMRRANPDEFLPDFMNRFNRIKNPKAQEQAIRFFTGREWLGEFGRMVKGIDTYKEAQKLAKEAKSLDAIGTVWELHKEKLGFVFKQISAGFKNILGEFGRVLSPMARQFGDYFLGWTAQLRAGGLAERFKAGIEGFLNGLGFKDLPALMEGIFGRPGEGAAGAVEQWRAAARGFGAGIRDVADAVRGALGLFSGGTDDPEAKTRWAARIMGFSAIAIVVGPAVTAIAGLTMGISALGSAAAAALSGIRVAGLAAGAGTAGAVGGLTRALAARVAGWISGGLVLGIAAELGANRAEISAVMVKAVKGLWSALVDGITSGINGAIESFKTQSRDVWMKSIIEGVLGFLDPNLARWYRNSGGPQGDRAPMVDEFGRDIGKLFQRQSYQNDSESYSSLVKNASYTTLSDINSSIERLDDTFRSMGVTLQRAGLVSPGFGGTGLGGGAGGGLGGGSGFGGGGRGGSTGRGSASGGSAVSIPDSVPMTADERNKLGLIMKYESGGQNRMNYVGKGQGLDPTTAKGYTAQGYFQMLNSNWRRIAPKLGITTPNAMASSLEDQTRVALHLLRNGGISNWSNYNPQLRAALARGEKAPAGTVPALGGSAGGSGKGVIDGARFTSDFGWRRHPLSGIVKPHYGVDLAAPAGTPVRAAKAGTVSIERSGDVKVTHPDGTSAVYRHVNAGVRAGQQVAAGQTIAQVRAHDPRSTGPHLHFEERDAQGRPVDPKGLLAASRVKAVTDQARAAGEVYSSSGWKPGPGGNATALDPSRTSSRINVERVPLPPVRPAGAGGPGGGRMVHVNAPITVNGVEDAAALANKLSGHLSEAWNRRATDLEPELT
jgi:TP901 family phage tail tape measure protein